MDYIKDVEVIDLERHETSAIEDISVGVISPEDLERYVQAWDQGVEKQKTNRKNQILQGDDDMPEAIETERTNVPQTEGNQKLLWFYEHAEVVEIASNLEPDANFEVVAIAKNEEVDVKGENEAIEV